MMSRKVYWFLGTLLVVGGAVLMTACTSVIASFGQTPQDERLVRVHASQNYINGEFQYFVPTPLWTGSRIDYLKETVFGESQPTQPAQPLPVIKTDLSSLDKDKNLVVWLGHSTLLIQIDGKRILIDPVFSSYTSPVPFISKAFKGDYPFTVESLPQVDYVIISHDHWDHLDYPTMTALKDKVNAVVMPLGVGSHLEKWGYKTSQLHEADWGEDIHLAPDLTVHVLPARHFSGRGLFSSNQTLWASFLIESPNKKIYYSGDGGYGPHFTEIGKRFNGVDLAIMENGQYDKHWGHVHMFPEEVVQAALDLKAKHVIPVHAGRFALASHAWDEPFERIEAASKGKSFNLLTPVLGDVVDLDNQNQKFNAWWRLNNQPSTQLNVQNDMASQDAIQTTH